VSCLLHTLKNLHSPANIASKAHNWIHLFLNEKIFILPCEGRLKAAHTANGDLIFFPLPLFLHNSKRA